MQTIIKVQQHFAVGYTTVQKLPMRKHELNFCNGQWYNCTFYILFLSIWCILYVAVSHTLQYRFIHLMPPHKPQMYTKTVWNIISRRSIFPRKIKKQSFLLIFITNSFGKKGKRNPFSKIVLHIVIEKVYLSDIQNTCSALLE